MLGRTHISTASSIGSGLVLWGVWSQKFVEPNQLFDSIGSFFVLSGQNMFKFLGLSYDHLYHFYPAFFHVNAKNILFWQLVYLWLLILVYLFAALLPDIDSDKSTLGRYVPWISQWIPHRTFTHTIYVVALLFGLAFWLNVGLLWCFAFGYFVHVFCDSFSVQGIAWFYPLSKYQSFGNGGSIKKGRKSRFYHYRTGGRSEMIFFWLTRVFSWLLWLRVLYLLLLQV